MSLIDFSDSGIDSGDNGDLNPTIPLNEILGWGKTSPDSVVHARLAAIEARLAALEGGANPRQGPAKNPIDPLTLSVIHLNWGWMFESFTIATQEGDTTYRCDDQIAVSGTDVHRRITPLLVPGARLTRVTARRVDGTITGMPIL